MFKPLYLPSDDELGRRFREELERRRQIRLNQVREQSKVIAAELREKVQQEKAVKIAKKKRKMKANSEQEKENQIQNLEELQQQCLSEVGRGHFQALQEPNMEEMKKQELEQFHLKAAERGKKAMSALQGLERDKDERIYSRHIPKTAAQGAKSKVTFPTSTVINALEADIQKHPSTRKDVKTNEIPAQPDIKHSVQFTVEKNVAGDEPKDAWSLALEHTLLAELAMHEKAQQRQTQDIKAKKRFQTALAKELETVKNDILMDEHPMEKHKRLPKGTRVDQMQKEAESLQLGSPWSHDEVQKQKKLEQEVESILEMLSIRNERKAVNAFASGVKETTYKKVEPKPSDVSSRDMAHRYKHFGDMLAEEKFRMCVKKDAQTSTNLPFIERNEAKIYTHLKSVPVTDACIGTDTVDFHDAHAVHEMSTRSSETNYMPLPSVLRQPGLLSSVSENLQQMGAASPHTIQKFLKSYRKQFLSTAADVQQVEIGSSSSPVASKTSWDGTDKAVPHTTSSDIVPCIQKDVTPIATSLTVPKIINPPVSSTPDEDTFDAVTTLQKKLHGEIRQKIFPVPSGEQSPSSSLSSKSSTEKSFNWDEFLHVALDHGEFKQPNPETQEILHDASSSTHYFPELTSQEEQPSVSLGSHVQDVSEKSVNAYLSEATYKPTDLESRHSDSLSVNLSGGCPESLRVLIEKQIQETTMSIQSGSSSSGIAASIGWDNPFVPKQKPPVTLGRLTSDQFVPHELSVIEEKESMGNQTQGSVELQNLEKVNGAYMENGKTSKADETSFTDLTLHTNVHENNINFNSDDSADDDASERFTYLSAHTPSMSGRFTYLSAYTPSANSEFSNAKARIHQTPGHGQRVDGDANDTCKKSSETASVPTSATKTDTSLAQSLLALPASSSHNSDKSMSSNGNIHSENNMDVMSTASTGEKIETPALTPDSYHTLPTPPLNADDSINALRENFWTDVLRHTYESTAKERVEKIGSELGSVKSLQTNLVIGQSTPTKMHRKDEENGILEEPNLTLVDVDLSVTELCSRSEDLNRTLTEAEASMLSHLDELIEKKKYLINVPKSHSGEPSVSESLMSFLLNEMSAAASVSSHEQYENEKLSDP